MNDRVDLTPDERRARDEVRALASPAAGAEFRARLSRAFASGTITAAPRPAARSYAANPWRWAVVPVAAAAVFLIANALNRGPGWQLTKADGEGIAVVDGRPVPMNHTDELAHRLRPGARVQVPDGATLEITSARTLCVELTGGTDCALPGVPGRWWGREVAGEVKHGELRITSGMDFRGARLALTTPEAKVMVSGTTLAVICETGGTCVCVLEGRVMVGPIAGVMQSVGGGMLRYVFNDARPVALAPMREVERVKLGAFRDGRKDSMGRR